MTRKSVLLCSVLFFLSGSTTPAIPDLEDVQNFFNCMPNFYMGTLLGLLPIFGHKRAYQAVTAVQFPWSNVPHARSAFVAGSVLGNYLWFYLFNELKERHGENDAYALAVASFVPFFVEHVVRKVPQPALRS